MDRITSEYTWSFQFAKQNILRCTLTRGTSVKNTSWIIENGVFRDLREPEANDSVRVEMDPSVVRLHLPNEYALEIAEFYLNSIDVIRYSTGSQAPCVEIVKTVDGQRTQISNLHSYVERKAFAGMLGFRIPKATGIFGLGQDEDGVYNKRGIKQYLYQHNMRTPMPFFLTNEGYGLLFDCGSLMIFDDTEEITRLYMDTVDQIDCYLITGTLDEMISGIRYLSGSASLLPKWAFGYIQSRERYQTQNEMIETAQRYRDLGIPLDCVVQDWKTWAGDLWGQKTVDRERYPDLPAMNDTLHKMHVHSMVSIWPNMAQGGADHTEFAEKGLLLGDYSTYDAFSEEARDLYWKQMERELVPGKFDSWWCDSTEPFTAPDWCGERLLAEEQRYQLVGGEHKKYLDPAVANLYALVHAKGIYTHQREKLPEKRVFNLTRSGYTGSQKYGVALWAGDASAKWEELRSEIAKGLNLCMCGIPFWTIDIGAFFVGGTACWRKWCGDPSAKPVWFWNGDYDEGVNNPAYRELYTRWLQFGAFLPLFRSHGTDTPREIWNFGNTGEPFYDAIAKSIRLRYWLMPYIYSMAMRVYFDDYTMMRSLLFDFPNDKRSTEIDDEFMFGDSLLICPVTQPMYFDLNGAMESSKKKACYLPKGTGWYYLWSGTYYEGGRMVTVDADIETMPVFVKAGSILLTQTPTQYADEQTETLDVTIYSGADACCTYYNDDGTSYDYLSGRYEKIVFQWNDEARQLMICEKNALRVGAIRMAIHFNHTETFIQYNGGDKIISLA